MAPKSAAALVLLAPPLQAQELLYLMVDRVCPGDRTMRRCTRGIVAHATVDPYCCRALRKAVTSGKGTQIANAGLKHLSALEELTHLEMRCLLRITGIIRITSIAFGCTSLIELDLKC
ncbi:hypothetical protein SETIT_8G221200v2 [Setaria italica]|uniref:Hydrophobic seed protein domain-containing protein n=1 Tax=Setaria italica TaxID=4555 RepID=A0A368SAD7_SETIT|nr:hypothetical protein SETIT_8G221200v2 [Setaria italica]